jgi:uncharacterized OB-fold protein
MCKKCGSLQSEWLPVSGQGTIWSWVVYHKAYFQGSQVPYTVGIVELAEGPLIATNLVDVGDQELKIGAPVEAVFHKVDDQLAVPLFRLSGQ